MWIENYICWGVKAVGVKTERGYSLQAIGAVLSLGCWPGGSQGWMAPGAASLVYSSPQEAHTWNPDKGFFPGRAELGWEPRVLTHSGAQIFTAREESIEVKEQLTVGNISFLPQNSLRLCLTIAYCWSELFYYFIFVLYFILSAFSFSFWRVWRG